METFSVRLKLLRKEYKVKQAELAEYLNISVRGYQCYEYGKGYPDVPGLVALADYFNVSLDYLMGRTERREINQ
ncbi:hypothetical protein I4100191B2_09370 [Clostridiales bacterium]